jgi:glycosyltransferase involved in cell wall biosynthesis
MMETGEASSNPADNRQEKEMADKPFVSIVMPGYNEAAVIERNLARLGRYMESLEKDYRWELIFINDGSTDKTGELAETFASTRSNVKVLHHATNFRLGQALRFGFHNCRGEYVVVMDSDLSYSPEHIERLLKTIKETKAKIVVASPYMEGGKISNVPWLRRFLSIWANRFLSCVSKANLSTLTGMVRAYDRKFLNSLSLKRMDMSINAEIIYKAMLLRARVVEIPAHLDWCFQTDSGVKRTSSMRILRSILAYLLSGFIFRPFIFFLLPGFALMLISTYPFMWVFIHTFNNLQNVPAKGSLAIRLSAAVALAFQQSPHTFLIGNILLMVSIQLISLGILALQSKNYFEELFYLGTTIYKSSQTDEEER